MRYDDWGRRSPRWAGIRSEMVDLQGTRVHFLHARGPADTPTQLLVHPMGATGTFWLDVIPLLAAHGPVIAPDLPGTFTGHTETPHPRAARAHLNARFLQAFTRTLGLERVIVHGWSMGGLVSLLFAQRASCVERLVLTSPTLPGPLTTPEALGWQTLGRLTLLAAVPALRGTLRLYGRQLLEAKLRGGDPVTSPGGGLDLAGGDLRRVSPELVALQTEERQEMRGRPDKLADAIVAFASALSAMYIDRRPVLDAIDRVRAPTLLLWGDQDPLIERPVVDYLLKCRPDWELRVFEGAGHLMPMEIPAAYAEAVAGRHIPHP
ncbi:alpha/beta fold hydrolase [Streptosporangium sp. NBC_01755]|uniref:alpha/beta fold hydrolase n=1 Tax=Streptosporangium sp. NBC_01755 TaxID=2975949 RepID=UPI002DD90D1B|nr:alpha/beta fold hydrolase [Streptosporangium sp. NBC_01755]WSC99973.1 alpha/beta fold hydrolase [Streptosporangium sp. NBC_01755]